MERTTKEEIGRIQYTVHQLLPTRAVAAVESILTLVMIAMGWISAPAEVFVRIPGYCGRRYLSVLRLLMAYWLLGTYTTIVTFISLLGGNPMAFFSGMYVKAGSQAFTLYYWLFLLMAAYHLYKMWQRRDIRWHSQSFGVSWLHWLPVRIGYWKIYTIAEPGIFMLVALVINRYDHVLGVWLIVSGAALALRNWWTYFELQGRVLDVIDAGIEAEFFAEATHGADIQETAGFVAVQVAGEELDQIRKSFDTEPPPDAQIPLFAEPEQETLQPPRLLFVPEKKKGRPKNNPPASVDE